MQITIDERQCGAGKTYEILSQLRNNVKNNQPTVVALPSINLANEYEKGLDCGVTIINSNETSNCVDALHNAMMFKELVIIITHHTLMNITFENIKHRKEPYVLIIDEAIDPWRNIEIKQQAKDKLFKDWTSVMSLDESLSEPGYYECSFKNILTSTLIWESKTAKQLLNENFSTFLTDSQVLKIEAGKSFALDFIQELNINVFEDWSSIHIAAAKFDMTFLSLYLKKHNMNYSVLPGCEFEKHTSDLIIYYPGDENGAIDKWGKAKRNNNPDFMKEVNEKVNELTKGRKTMMLLNKGETPTGKYPNAVTLQHNNFGSNSYFDFTDVILESTLNHKPVMTAWYEQNAIDVFGLDKKEADQWAFNARTGYAYYQTLLRGCARKKKPINAYVIDNRAIECLLDCFQVKEENVIQWTPKNLPESKEAGRPSNSHKLTSSEYSKIRRAKKKDPEKYKDLSLREILNLIK